MSHGPARTGPSAFDLHLVSEHADPVGLAGSQGLGPEQFALRPGEPAHEADGGESGSDPRQRRVASPGASKREGQPSWQEVHDAMLPA